MPLNELKTTIKKDLEEKNSTIANLKKQLAETKAETKLLNKTVIKKSTKQNIYTDQRVKCLINYIKFLYLN